MIALLTPFQGVGDFLLDTPISNYSSKYIFEHSTSEYTDSEVYTIYDPEITVWTKEGTIDSIGCYEECFYEKMNLIGITLQQFINHTNGKFIGEPEELDFEEDSIVPQLVYEFDRLGLQVWTKENIVITIIVGSYVSDSDE